MTAAPLFKAVVDCTRADMADVVAVLELTPHPAPVAVLTYEDPLADDMQVEALYADEPDAALLTRLAGRPVRVEPLPDHDWIRASQEGLPPVRAGRFFVHGAHDKGRLPPSLIPVGIEAGLAFGTGHHETTAACLQALSDLARTRRFRRVLDLGAGTGLLAIGAAKLWRVPVLAADIDPQATETARANAAANGCAHRIRTVTADGFAHESIRARAPYDLIVANILAGPLTRLAPALRAHLAPGGVVVLSGLLTWQEKTVLGFYSAQGLRLVRRIRLRPWSALILRR